MVKNILLFSVLILAFSSQAGLINGIYDPGSTPINEREQFVANQVIVKFKSGYDPETLKAKVMQRTQLSRTFLGKIRVMFMDLLAKTVPMRELQLLETVNKQAGAVNQEILAIESDKSTYIITLNGKKSVEKAVEIYSKLSFVEYAEANYLVYPMNQSLP
ncbi:hypothetical protein A2690_01525 [Candidatus Roizmanbacteria bacterium RIFCSPHIGHO2_01_FULL_39_12b]|uniref:Fervidolysin-like N-terminal prodomain domain-containing protein n=1 Tax=Candidatus Roizmanbacteria bacterium RIFCSPHIGHO2_01_FULL_39_12b TaxID=1802030 RepID=A0A1F7G7N9_9BACT|nr:MAG: hypothetical protein A2690_01525 [Candidatus Roizmanbacteria bacterium RIFCSPHIGHO2_01_FULL_39_12b]OGK45850.1 MAG: hypothetical protein A3B46_03560 [Candidatus Roizmanbacteria bacterium RIFCSPLOWO2_01_FULL_39_19]